MRWSVCLRAEIGTASMHLHFRECVSKPSDGLIDENDLVTASQSKILLPIPRLPRCCPDISHPDSHIGAIPKTIAYSILSIFDVTEISTNHRRASFIPQTSISTPSLPFWAHCPFIASGLSFFMASVFEQSKGRRGR